MMQERYKSSREEMLKIQTSVFGAHYWWQIHLCTLLKVASISASLELLIGIRWRTSLAQAVSGMHSCLGLSLSGLPKP